MLRAILSKQRCEATLNFKSPFSNFQFQSTRLLPFSWLQPVKHPRERNRFADVLQSANPRDGTLDAHAESGMRNGSVFAKIEIPLEGFARQVVFLDPLSQEFIARHALAATYDFTITLGREHVHAKRDVRP